MCPSLGSNLRQQVIKVFLYNIHINETASLSQICDTDLIEILSHLQCGHEFSDSQIHTGASFSLLAPSFINNSLPHYFIVSQSCVHYNHAILYRVYLFMYTYISPTIITLTLTIEFLLTSPYMKMFTVAHTD